MVTQVVNHGDLALMNALWDGAVVALLDFEFAVLGPAEIDLCRLVCEARVSDDGEPVDSPAGAAAAEIAARHMDPVHGRALIHGAAVFDQLRDFGIWLAQDDPKERVEDWRPSRLLTDLLEISRFDAGAAELNLDEIDLGQIAAEELRAQGRLADTYGTPLVLDAPEPCVAEVDARRIRRILRNLITNAIEHGEGRTIVVHVRGDDAAVAVAVRDHGVGFSAAQAHQVFNRFWRADPARRRTAGGTGLGLSIAMEDARLHGGWLNAWGRPGQGAQFRLTVPRRAGESVLSSPWPVVPDDAEVPA